MSWREKRRRVLRPASFERVTSEMVSQQRRHRSPFTESSMQRQICETQMQINISATSAYISSGGCEMYDSLELIDAP